MRAMATMATPGAAPIRRHWTLHGSSTAPVSSWPGCWAAPAAERVVFTCNLHRGPEHRHRRGCSPPVTMCCPLTASTTPCCGPCTGWRGVEVDFLPADRRGCIDYDDFRRLLRPNTRGIICTHGSNLTGNLLDIRAIGRFAKSTACCWWWTPPRRRGVRHRHGGHGHRRGVLHRSQKPAGAARYRRTASLGGGHPPLQGRRHRCADVSAPAAAPVPHPAGGRHPTATASPGCRRRWTIWRRRGWRPSAAMSRRWPGSFTRGCPLSPASPYTATSPHGTGRRWCL